MPFAPEGAISLVELLELVVAKRHGQDAIAEIEGTGYSGEETESSFQIDDKLDDASPAIKKSVAIKKAASAKAWLEDKGTLQGFEDRWQQHIKPTYRQRPAYVLRASKKILATEDDKRWGGALAAR